MSMDIFEFFKTIGTHKGVYYVSFESFTWQIEISEVKMEPLLT